VGPVTDQCSHGHLGFSLTALKMIYYFLTLNHYSRTIYCFTCYEI
jgi:hypothetical protein